MLSGALDAWLAQPGLARSLTLLSQELDTIRSVLVPPGIQLLSRLVLALHIAAGLVPAPSKATIDHAVNTKRVYPSEATPLLLRELQPPPDPYPKGKLAAFAAWHAASSHTNDIVCR